MCGTVILPGGDLRFVDSPGRKAVRRKDTQTMWRLVGLLQLHTDNCVFLGCAFDKTVGMKIVLCDYSSY